MRFYAIVLAALATLFVFAEPAFAQRFEIGPGGVRIDGGRRGPDCRELRRACEFGERGEGNCRRYREVCADRAQRRESCEDLRAQCRYGERGEGNCRRYREVCGR